MAKWRERGYVPDSDEDEDDIIESPELHRSVPKIYTPTSKHNSKTELGARDPSSSPNPSGELPAAASRPSNILHERNDSKESVAQDYDSLPSISKILGENVEPSKQDEADAVAVSVTISIPPRLTANLFSSSPPPVEQHDGSQSHDIQSEASSPLSSIRSFSTILSPSRNARGKSPSIVANVEQEEHNDMAPEGQSSPHQRMDTDADEDLSFELLEQLEGVRRSKRQRAPIQLHPYMLEEQRYQQTVKSRGLRPVRVAYTQERNCHIRRNSKGSIKDADAETEDGYDAYESPTREPPVSLPGNSPSNPASVPRRDNPQDAFNIPINSDNDLAIDGFEQSSNGVVSPSQDDEELPDVQTLLQGRVDDSVYHVQKRRKTKHIYGKRNLQSSKTAKPIELTSSNIQPEHSGTNVDQATVSNWLPSVPSSSPLVMTQFRDKLPSGFQIPRGGSPPPLPTPATSSELWKPQDTNSLPISSSLPESDNEDGDDVTTQDKSPSPTRKILRLDETLHLQRRIRGVLPASWLRLDQQAQSRSFKSSPSKHSGRHREQTKGIARKVLNGYHSRATPPNSAILISDESDDDDVGPSLQSFLSRASVQPDNDDDGHALSDGTSNVTFETPIDLDDIREDNRIDFMLPSLPRPTKRSRTAKRQTRLNVSSTVPAGYMKQSSHRINKSKTKKQPRIMERLPRNRNHAKSKPAPRLSILDSTDLRRSPQRAPRFLKLAARQVRSKHNKGCHSATKKFVRLSTRADTEEATRILNRWRNGDILQPAEDEISHSGNPRSRLPLKDRQANEQVPSSNGKALQLHTPNRDNITRPNQSRPQKPARLGKQQNLASRQGHLVSSFRMENAPRAAQLEAVSTTQQKRASSRHFADSLRTLNRTNLALHSSRGGSWNVPLSRFLDEPEATVQELWPLPSGEAGIQQPSMRDDIPHTQILTRRPKKRPPKRLDTEIAEVRQPALPVIEIDDFEHDDSVASPASGVVLSGFASPYEAYSVNFDTAHVQLGTYFHQDSFVGSGELAQSVNMGGRDLDRSAGYASFQFHNQCFRWGPWNEIVSSNLGAIFQGLSDSLESPDQERFRNADATIDLHGLEGIALRSITSYVTNHLSFSDRIDRESYATRCIRLLGELSAVVDSTKSRTPSTKSLQILAYAFVFANQIRQVLGQLASTKVRSSTLQDDVMTLLEVLAEHSLSYLSSDIALEEIRSFLEANKQHREREAGVKDENIYVCATVIIHHVIESGAQMKSSIWTTFSSQLAKSRGIDPSNTSNVRDLEELWSGVFALLPILEIDVHGIFNPRARFLKQADNWAFVQKLAQNITERYLRHPKGQRVAFNNYFRAISSRCFVLLKYWGWKKCEKILEIFFDFFAKTGLANLQNEDPFGSPKFLDALENDPILELEPSDRSFHILLKLIGQGVRGLNQIYSKSQVRNIVWRLMPNHGRSYPKENTISHTDLDALRNQHDLFCTLYWASPAGCRPRIGTIRNLVHPSSSHREACSISIHSWARLLRYQLTTDEPASMLVPFADWLDEFVSQMLEQHNAARAEAESVSAVMNISVFFMESAVAENQRHTEALLTDALLSLSKAFKLAKVPAHTQALLTSTTIPGVFRLLDTRNSRVNAVIVQALDVVMSYICSWQCHEKPNSNDSNSDPSEDSQEFGDWSGFDEVYQDQSTNHGIQHLHNTIYESLARLVSNCFGSDASPPDSLLLRLTECWTAIAHASVKTGLKQWSNYMDSYERESWACLRNTDQTRKFAPLFFASILEKDPGSFEDNKDHMLNLWLSSLVERESKLKFQHQFTSALLNVGTQDPLLLNLPFSVDPRSSKYDVSMEDFKQCRLALLSCLLSNMRASFFETSCESRVQAQQLRQEYRELLQHLMSVMKSNYQELGPEATAKGAYVDFVHRVVDYLQQYTVEICPVDRFFTDSAAFPLPANDPTYVIGRLRNYGLRLSEPGVPKQLVTFIQNVSERAAVDEEQEFLVDQLHAAMSSGTYEAGTAGRPTLRAFLLQNVFPAYLELSLSNLVGWPVIEPILRSIQLTMKDLILDINFSDSLCVESVTSMIFAMFESLRASIDNYQGPALPNAIFLRVLRTTISTVASTLPVVDYAVKSSADGGYLLSYIKYFEEFAAFLRSSDFAPGACAGFPVSSDELLLPNAVLWHEARHFAARELYNTLRKNWGLREGIVYFQRGVTSRKELRSVADNTKAEEEALHESLRSLKLGMEVMGFAQDGIENLNSNVWARRRFFGIDERQSINGVGISHLFI